MLAVNSPRDFVAEERFGLTNQVRRAVGTGSLLLLVGAK
jgi:hypothetical protein